MALYINGNLHSFKAMSGKMRTTGLDLLFGQMIPGDQNYNFAGLLDEIKIFDYAVTPPESESLFASISTGLFDEKSTVQKLLIYPNPVSDYLNVELPDLVGSCSIYNSEGQLIFQNTIPDIYKGGQIKINTYSWPAGSYVIVVHAEQGIWTNKFIKLNN